MEEIKHAYIICLNNNTVYQGVREAERITGADHSNISKVCMGKRCSVNRIKISIF